MSFASVLFEQSGDGERRAPSEPDYFGDLNLDQVLVSLTAGREHYELAPFFYAPLHDPAVVQYRHEVLRDLERPDVLQDVTNFAGAMARMREHLEQRDALRHELQRQSWFVDAVEIYCEAVRALADGLAMRELDSRGMRGLHGYLSEYVASDRYTSLVADTRAVKEALATIRYRLCIDGPRVTVSRYEDDADYSVGVLETFARFRQGAVTRHLATLPTHLEMDHIEEQILELVAALHPDAFDRRAEYCARHADYLDATIGRFDREVQLYVAYLELIAPLRAAGLAFCYPGVSAPGEEITARDTFDIALATKLVTGDRPVVVNDFSLTGPERVLVVSGPNNGGKTTFARTFGQLHHLAGLGLLVPGRQARLSLPDRIYTHFEREEDIETLRSKFEDELVRVHEILQRATSRSVIVMNESFNSTTLHDALFVGTEVMRQILELDCLGVYVTFVDEIASLGEQTVSMVAQIVAEDPAQRTFKVLRRPADGLAYASAIADKYGLTYTRLMEQIGR
jgi:DNA mismatch repair protein MutS